MARFGWQMEEMEVLGRTEQRDDVLVQKRKEFRDKMSGAKCFVWGFVAGLVITPVALWIGVTKLMEYYDPQLSDAEMYEMASLVVKNGENDIRQISDSLFADYSGGVQQLFFKKDDLLHKLLTPLGARHSKLSDVYICPDEDGSPLRLETLFGGRTRCALFVIYPSEKDVSSVEGVHWIAKGIGVEIIR